MPVITLVNGKNFSAEVNEKILDAALRSGILLEHSCKTGRCSSCKVRLKTGSTISVVDEIGLIQTERDAGWILSCVRSATTDVQLDAEDIGNFQLYPTKTLPCRIQSLEKLNDQVLRVILRLPPNQQLGYHPGQYIDVIGKDGLRRSYSVANAPTADKLIELHIGQVANGLMSRYWFDEAKPNDLLRLSGPLGTFFLREVAGLDVIFLATGTGIAPVKAMLEGLSATSPEHMPRSVSVYWGGRIPQDHYLSQLSAFLPLQYFPVLSRADVGWLGLRGYVQQALVQSGVNLADTVVYACGSPAMIEDARHELVITGLDERRFFSDAFVSSSQNLKVNQ